MNSNGKGTKPKINEGHKEETQNQGKKETSKNIGDAGVKEASKNAEPKAKPKKTFAKHQPWELEKQTEGLDDAAVEERWKKTFKA